MYSEHVLKTYTHRQWFEGVRVIRNLCSIFGCVSRDDANFNKNLEVFNPKTSWQNTLMPYNSYKYLVLIIYKNCAVTPNILQNIIIRLLDLFL